MGTVCLHSVEAFISISEWNEMGSLPAFIRRFQYISPMTGAGVNFSLIPDDAINKPS
jgi:hypothetical protein